MLLASQYSAAVASACARASNAVGSQEELLGVALDAAVEDGDEDVVERGQSRKPRKWGLSGGCEV